MAPPSLSPPPVTVTFGPPQREKQILTFNGSFVIGRTDDCDVTIKDEFVSRAHVRVLYEQGQWWIRDLQSANGIFVNEQRVETLPIQEMVTFRLGVRGPFVRIEVTRPEPPPPPPPQSQPQPQPQPPLPFSSQQFSAPKIPAVTDTMMVAHYVDHYFTQTTPDKPIGEHTMIVRRAFQQVQKKQRFRYAWIAGILVLLLLGAGGYAFYEHQQISKHQAMAKDLFYAMKALDVDIANVENLVRDSNNPQGIEQVRKYQSRRKEMQKNYDQFLTTLHVYNPKMTEEERLILRVARIFGECELDMPPDLRRESKITSPNGNRPGRLGHAIRLAER